MNSFLVLFDLVGELTRRRYQAADRYFSTIGLNHTEARMLTLLQREGGGTSTQDVLSNMLYIDRSNAGRALKRLEQEGYVRRSRGQNDKRTNLVQITAKGRTAVSEISKLRKKMAQGFFGDLTANEATEVVALLKKALAKGEA